MKGMKVGLLFGCSMVAACVPERQPPAPAPAPAVRPQPAPLARPAPPPPAPLADWRDRPLTPGTWVYGVSGATSQAGFGLPGGEAQFLLRCDRARRQVSLWREGRSSGNVMVVRTTGQSRSLPLSAQAAPRAFVWTALPANDRFLDEILFSRGRIMVEAAGLPALIVPSWAEPARVVEDCRG